MKLCPSLYALYASAINVNLETSLEQKHRVYLSGEAYCAFNFLFCIFYTILSSLVPFLPMQAVAGIVALTVVAAPVCFFVRIRSK
jgi:predicted benzoate:H+ symporter BenE